MSEENKNNTDGAVGLSAELERFTGAGANTFRYAENNNNDSNNTDNTSNDNSNSSDSKDSKSRLENPNISLDDFAKDLGPNSRGLLDRKEDGEETKKDEKKVDDSDKEGSKSDDKKIVDDKDKKSEVDNKKDEGDKSKRVESDKGDDGFKNQRNAENRDVTGFTDQVATWLKRMPQDGYNFFAKQLREKAEYEKTSKEALKALETKVITLEKGKQVLPESYYEHPESVVLTQDFKDLQSSVSLAAEIEQHWEQQLITVSKLKEGDEAVIYGLKTDDKGQIYVDDKNPIKVDDSNKVNLQISLQKYARDTAGQTSMLRGQLTQLVNDYGNKHKEYVSKIAAAEDTYMPWFKDEKSDEHKYYKSVAVQLAEKGIPRSNPIFNMLAKSVAMNLILKDALAKIGSSSNKEQRIKDQQRQGGPVGDEFTGGEDKGGRSKINNIKQFDGLPAINL